MSSLSSHIFDVSQFDKQECDFLGGLCAWELSNFWKGKVGEVQAAITREGLNYKSMVTPSPKIAIARSATHVAATNSIPGNEYVADKAGEDANSYVYVIYNKRRENKEKVLKFNCGTRITFNKGNGEITYEGDFADEVKNMHELFLTHYTDDDLRLFIRATIIESYGIKFRNSGAVYIIPKQGMDRLSKLDKILKEFTAGHIIMLGVPARSHEKGFILDSFISDLESRINDIQHKIGKVNKRSSALKRQEKALQECEKLSKIYADILEDEAKLDDLKTKMSEATNLIAKKMIEITS